MKKFNTLTAILAALTLCSCSSTPSAEPPAQEQTGSQSQDNTDIQEVEQPTGHEGNIELVYAISGNISDEEQAVIDQFNKADNGFTVRTEQYAPEDWLTEFGYYAVKSSDDLLTADFRLIQDLINSDKVDIVSSYSFADIAKMELMENKGAFADLYPYMANDPTVNKSTLNEHILSLSEKDGKLCHLPVWYYVSTMVGDPKYVGTANSWTVDDFMERWEVAKQDGATFNGNLDSEYVYMNTIRSNLPSYVDYENAEVHFDCDEFRRLLEFCSQFESCNGQKGEYLYNAPIFVAPRQLHGFRDANEFFNDDGSTTVIGFPTDSGSGAYFSTTNYAVVAQKDAERQRGAWEFIKTFADYEYQSENYVRKQEYMFEGTNTIDYSEEGHFAINNKVFDEKMQAIMNGEFMPILYDHETGERLYIKPTKTECDRLIAYMNSIDRLETRLDESLFKILNEEIFDYLGGKTDLDRCIDLIQNRCSIYISEQQ